MIDIHLIKAVIVEMWWKYQNASVHTLNLKNANPRQWNVTSGNWASYSLVDTEHLHQAKDFRFQQEKALSPTSNEH